MSALKILQKLRKYELEKEEHQLMLRHQEEFHCKNNLSKAHEKLSSDLNAKSDFSSTQMLQHLEMHFWESEENIKNKTVELQKSVENREVQIQKTLLSKQRLDMIDRVLEHRHQAHLAELDQRERKFLDDVSQSRYALGASQ